MEINISKNLKGTSLWTHCSVTEFVSQWSQNKNIKNYLPYVQYYKWFSYISVQIKFSEASFIAYTNLGSHKHDLIFLRHFVQEVK
jgi:hypothetical protein